MHAIADEGQLRAAARPDVDWLARWRELVVAEHAQSERAAGPSPGGEGDWWAGQAGRFAAFARRAAQPDAFLQLVLPHLRPEGSVLEIGAGTGRHAAFLARHAARVVAVEPSAGMRAQLERRLAEERLANVSVVAASWPAPVPPCDLALAAHVVYAVPEIGPFLRAMDAAAQHACFLLVGLRQPSYFVAPVWERVYGEPRLPLPGAVECLGALRQLGIAPEIALLPATPYRFADAEEALADLRWRLHIAPGSPHDAALQQALAELLVADAEGGLVVRQPPSLSAVLWWVKAAPGA
jgi:SAM-dependent methyltransferase